MVSVSICIDSKVVVMRTRDVLVLHSGPTVKRTGATWAVLSLSLLNGLGSVWGHLLAPWRLEKSINEYVVLAWSSLLPVPTAKS